MGIEIVGDCYCPPTRTAVAVGGVMSILNQKIYKHGTKLNDLFMMSEDPIKLCKKLFRLENKGRRLAIDWCNGDLTDEQWEKKSGTILDKVKAMLDPDNVDVEIFMNGDARGYTIKIRFDDMDERSCSFYCDMGGYGIIAPDLREAA